MDKSYRNILALFYLFFYGCQSQSHRVVKEYADGKLAARRTKATLEDINNNKAVLIQKFNMSADSYHIGLSVRILNGDHQLSFSDSSFLEYKVLK